MRAALYIRVSSEDQARGTSPQTQESDLRKWAEREDWTITGTYSEHVSGAAIRRPEFERMIQDSANFDRVLVWDPSRFGRAAESVQAWLALKANGVSVWEYQDRRELDEAPFLAELSASVKERERIRARTMRGRLEVAEEGKWMGGAFPFGVMTDSDGYLIENPEQAEMIREAFKIIVEGGTTGDVAREFNSRGLTTGMRRAAWTPQAVRKLLRQSRLSSGKLDRPGWGVSLPHPELLTPGQHKRLIELLDDAQRKRGRRNDVRHYPLTGHLRCDCRATMTGWKIRGVPVYRCSNRYPVSDTSCKVGPSYYNAERLEQEVWDSLFEDGGMFGSTESLTKAVSRAVETEQVTDADVTSARAKVDKLTSALARADAQALTDDSDRLRKAAQVIADDLEQARETLDTMEALYGAESERRETWDALAEAAGRVDELRNESSGRQRKLIFEAMQLRATIHPGDGDYMLAITGSVSGDALAGRSTG